MDRSLERKLWSQPNLRLFVRLVAFLFLMTLPLIFWQAKPGEISIRRGDFPAFYSAAVLAAASDYQNLYNIEANKEIQQQYWPSSEGRMNVFIYPPFVGLLLIPLSWFSPYTAQLIFISVMLICLLLAVKTAGSFIPWIRRSHLDAFLIFLLFPSVANAIFGGQASTLSLLCFTLVLSGLSKSSRYSDRLTGIALGLWLWKPHYPLLISFFLLVAGHWRFLPSFMSVALVAYLLSAFVSGPFWPAVWLTEIYEPATLVQNLNSFNLISINGAALSLSRDYPEYEVLIYGIAWSFIAVLFLLLIALFFRMKYSRPEQLIYYTALLGPAILLLSPHSFHYDLTLCTVSAAACFHAKNDRQISFIVTGYLYALYFTTVRGQYTVTPLLYLLLFLFFYLLWNIKSRRSTFR